MHDELSRMGRVLRDETPNGQYVVNSPEGPNNFPHAVRRRTAS